MFKRRFSFILAVLLLAVGIVPAYAAADPLDEWQNNPLPAGYSLKTIAYGNGTFVAIGSYGLVLTSNDGTVWTRQLSVPPYELYDIVYGNGLFVAPDGYGNIWTTADGITWTKRETPPLPNPEYGYPPSVERVDFAAGQFKIVGLLWQCPPDGSPCWYLLSELTSSNGINWSHKLSEIESMGAVIAYLSDDANWNRVKDKAFGNFTYVKVGRDGLIQSSSDGVNWTNRISGTTKDLYAIVYGNGKFVAVGEDGVILQTSPLAPVSDKTPPVTKYAVTPIWVNDGGKKYIKGYTVTLTATDDLTGVKQTYYRINGGTWKVYTAPFALYGGVSTSLDFYSEDNAGNKEVLQ
jgi:hypothetical protein